MFSLKLCQICHVVRYAALLVLLLQAFVQSQELPKPKANEPAGRRVYVPVEDLDVVIERDQQGVILPREEFLKLTAAARKNLEQFPQAPRDVVLSQANYQARPQGDQLVVTATVEFTQFVPGWQSILLPFRGVSVESATVDDKPAQLGRAAMRQPVAKPQAANVAMPVAPEPQSLVLFNNVVGSHVLKLEFSVNLVAVGSDRVAAFGFPIVASGRLAVTLPAGKYLQVDEVPLERPTAPEQTADYSIALGGKREISLRITDRQTQQSSSALVFATSAIGVHAAAEELTWRAVSTVQVFGRSIDGLQFSVPSTLDIVSVESTGLERWEIVDGTNPTVTQLNLFYRQPFQEERSITIKGVASTKLGTPWSVPTLSLSQAVSHVARVIVQHPPGLRLQVVETRGVRRIGLEDIAGTDMPDMGKTAVDSSRTLHFAAWQQDYSLVLVTQPKAGELQTTIATRLDVTTRELILRSSIVAQTRFAPLFELDVTLPAEWTVTEVLAANQPAVWQTLPTNAGLHHVRISFNPPISIGGSVPLTVVARLVPTENWPLETTPLSLKLPEVYLPQAGVTEGTYLIGADDDLDVSPQELTGLDPARLPAGQQPAANVPRLTYDYQDTRFSGRLQVSRKPSRITAYTLAFHRLDRESLRSHLESLLKVAGGGTRTLQVALSESAGTNLRFRLIGSSYRLLEQQPATPAAGEILWTLQLDEIAHGNLVLAVDLEIPRSTETQAVAPPMLRIASAELEEGHIAIEAGADQYLTITATDAANVPLTEIDPPDMPRPAEYTPRERIVAAYHTVRGGARISLTESRFDRLAVPTAVGDRLEITSILGDTTGCQHRTQLTFRAVGVQSLRLQLPREAVLWATLIDGQPLEVRRLAGEPIAYAVPLPPAATAVAVRTLQLFYRTTHESLSASGKLVEELPTISVVNGQGETQPLEILSRHWTLHHPQEMAITDISGPFEPSQKPLRLGLLGWLQRNLRVGSQDEILKKTITLAVAAAIVALLALGFRRRRYVGLLLVLGGGLLFAILAIAVFPAMQGAVRSSRESALASKFSDLPAVATGEPLAHMHGLADEAKLETSAMDGVNAPAAPPAVAKSAAPAGIPASQDFEERYGKVKVDRKAGAAMGGAEFTSSLGFGVQPAQPTGRNGELATEALPVDALGDTRQARPITDAGGLLSLSLDFDPPAGSLASEFEYAGSGPATGNVELAIDYQNRQDVSHLELIVQLAVLLVFWFARQKPVWFRASLGTLGLAIPASVAPLAAISLLPWLDGLFLGSVWGLILWLLLWVGSRISTRFHTVPSPAATALLFAAILNIGSSSGFGDEPEASSHSKKASTIVIPYESSESPLQASRVFLPHDKFLELYHAAYPEKRGNVPAPVEGLVAEALYVAAPVKNAGTNAARIDVTARMVVHSFRNGQVTLPIPLQPVALSVAKLDGRPAALVSRTVSGKTELAVVLAERGTHVLDLHFELPVEQNGPAGKFTLPSKPVPAGSLQFTLPARDLTVQVNGTSTAFRQLKQEDKTVVIVPLADSDAVTLAWTPAQSREKTEGTVQAEAVTSVILRDTGMLISTGVTFEVRQGTLSEADFALPPGLLVRQITGLDLGGWEMAGEVETRSLKVFFRRPVTDSTTLVFELFQPQQFSEASTTVPVPAFAPRGVVRETGTIAVFAEPQLTVAIGSASGVSQIDAGQFSPAVNIARLQTPPLFAYRYASRPVELPLLVSRRKPQSQGVAEHAVLISPRKLRVSSRLELTLAGAPRSEVTLQLPPGYLLYDLQCPVVADHFVETPPGADGKQPSVLHVELSEPMTGTLEIILDGVVPRVPEDVAASIALPMPLDVDELRSSVAIWLDRALQGNVPESGTWKSIAPDQLSPRIRQLRNVPVQFAFTSLAANPGAIGLTLARSVPRVTADSLTAVVVEESAVHYVLSLQWNITVAEESRFTFTTPDWLEGRLDFSANKNGPRIRQIVSEKIAGNRIRWTLTLDEPQRERYFVTAIAVLPPATERIDYPSIVFEQLPATPNVAQPTPLDTQRHYVLLVNQSPYQLDSTAPDALETLPAEELPIKIGPQLVDQATTIARIRNANAAIGWQARSLAQLRSLRASVNLMELTLAVSRDGTWRGQADLRIVNRARQFLPLVMPEQSQVLSLFVAGVPSRPVRTRRGERDVLLVPLPKTAEGDLSAEVRLVFTGRLPQPLPRGVRVFRHWLDLPAPRVLTPAEDAEFGIETARTSWTVHLPADMDVVPLDDLDRTNVTQSVAGYDRLVSEMNEALQLFNTANYVSRSGDYGMNSLQQSRALNNLKVLNYDIERLQRDPYSRTTAGSIFNQEQAKELQELNEKLQVAQQQADSIQLDLSRTTQSHADGKKYVPTFSMIVTDLQQANERGKDSPPEEAKRRDADDDFRFKQEAAPAVPLAKTENAGKRSARAAAAAGAPAGKPQASNRAELRNQAAAQAQSLNAMSELKQPATDRDEVMQLDPRANSMPVVQAPTNLGIPLSGGGVAGGLGGGGGGAGGEVAQVQAPPAWTAAGGLSLEIDIPRGGQVLTFSKIGGDPKLALGLRPHVSSDMGMGVVWAVVGLALGGLLLIALSRPDSTAVINRGLPYAMLALGCVWYFALPGAAAAFVLILAGGMIQAWRVATRPAT